MPLRILFHSHTLLFHKQAGTSRGVLTEKKIRVVRITDMEHPGIEGVGECGPLAGLSIDDIPDFDEQLAQVCTLFNALDLEVFPFNLPIILDQVVPQHLPSVRFGVEMALLDFLNGGRRVYFENAFSRGETGIEINGLIWMGSYHEMTDQIREKLAEGYKTLKMKVGALDFDTECRILGEIRSRFGPDEITLRVDANGAFSSDDAVGKLSRLSQFELHSIEQPIRAGQVECMAELCAVSPVPVALDEELIGIMDYRQKYALLKRIKPAYIILKPGLLGGFQQTKEWIEIANRLRISWWITSALESNIGLAAIAQFTASFSNLLPQGLGTGKLYKNNFSSPLCIEGGRLYSDPTVSWDVPAPRELFI